MFFDTSGAAAKIRSGNGTPATSATLRHETPEPAGLCRKVANVATATDPKADPNGAANAIMSELRGCNLDETPNVMARHAETIAAIRQAEPVRVIHIENLIEYRRAMAGRGNPASERKSHADT